MLVNREVLLCKVESAYNTDPTPTEGANAILVENLAWAPEGARQIERQAIRSSIGKLKQLYGGTLISLTFDAEIKGSGAAGTAPEMGILFRGCAMGETIVASTSVAYSPVSTGHESVTFYYYQDGTLLKVTGARGNMTASLAAGNVGKCSFTFTGHLVSVTDVALASPTYNSAVPGVNIGTSFTVGGYSAIVNELIIDLANELGTPADMSASDGYSQVRVIGRDVQGSFDPEHVLVATNDFVGDWQAASALALSTGTIGSAGNQYAVSLPAISYRNVSPADREGVRTLELPYGAAESSGDDEITITFT